VDPRGPTVAHLLMQGDDLGTGSLAAVSIATAIKPTPFYWHLHPDDDEVYQQHLQASSRSADGDAIAGSSMLSGNSVQSVTSEGQHSGSDEDEDDDKDGGGGDGGSDTDSSADDVVPSRSKHGGARLGRSGGTNVRASVRGQAQVGRSAGGFKGAKGE